MLNLAKYSLLLSVALIASDAHASEAASGYVSGIYGTPQGKVLFVQSGARTALPSCQGENLGAYWSMDGSDSVGQAQIAILLTAYVQHKPVVISGSGNCTAWNDMETVQHFHIAD